MYTVEDQGLTLVVVVDGLPEMEVAMPWLQELFMPSTTENQLYSGQIKRFFLRQIEACSSSLIRSHNVMPQSGLKILVEGPKGSDPQYTHERYYRFKHFQYHSLYSPSTTVDESLTCCPQ